MNDETFVTWIEDVAEGASEQYEVRISVREQGEWIERRRIIDNANELELKPGPEEETRYYLRTASEQGHTEKWERYRFPLFDEGEEESSPEDGIEVILEIPASVDIESVPWAAKESFSVPSKVLNYVDERDGFSPVDANRVAGLEAEKERLERFLDTSNSGWGLADETGVILEGPPGTGKTELVIELCQEMYGSMPVMISGPEILSKWVGESERMLRRKFEEARNSNQKQPVLYIDELDAIARTRSEASEDYSAQVVAQLLVLLDGVEAKQESERGEPLKVIASTNLSHVVDPALRRPGRLGSRPIQFERLSPAERKAILHHYLEKIRRSDEGQLGDQLQSFVTDVEGEHQDILEDIVAETDGFTGADSEDLIQESVAQLQRDRKERLTLGLLEEVLEEDFEPSEEICSQTFERLELAALDTIEVPLESRVYKRDGGIDPQDVAKGYFYELADENELDKDILLKYREIAPGDLLENDLVRAKENVVEAFQQAENERVCLYIRDAEELAQARERSSVVDRLIGVINEQILQWNRDNLVILDAVPDRYSQITNIGDD